MLNIKQKAKISAAIYGCAGLELTAAEHVFFAAKKPLGFILFKRNIDTPEQVRALINALKIAAGHPDVLILVDQEGGRVQRFKAPHWPSYPPAAAYEAMASSPFEQREYVRLGARLMAHDLKALGVNVDCAPVLDVPQAGTHDVVGDRAYGVSADSVAVMGRAAAEGLLAGGVLPVIKHAPGHGRATVDSHQDLPVVKARRDELDKVDFLPFTVNADMPIAMTAHVVYTALDRRNPATTSKKVIKVIREEIGFDGLLLTDDIGMGALKGPAGGRARAALRAGCDIVLHCSGDLEEMKAVSLFVPPIKGKTQIRLDRALVRLKHRVEPLNVDEARGRLQVVLHRPVAVREEYEDFVDPTAYQEVF